MVKRNHKSLYLKHRRSYYS